MIPFVMTKNGLTLYLDDAVVVNKDHPNYEKVLAIVTNTDATVAEVEKLVDLPKAIEEYSAGNLKVSGDGLFWKGTEIKNSLAMRLIEMMKASKGNTSTFNNMIAFFENLMQNPSFRAVNELFDFLNACTLPITTDGCFLAYKKVRSDYKDIHSGTFDNSIGQKLEVPRNMVDENPEQTCSYGLHVCSYGYLEHFSSSGDSVKVVIVKVNPKDVVAVPKDYNNQKMRVCAYEVVGEVPLNTEIEDRYTTEEYGAEEENLTNDHEWFEDDEPNTDIWECTHKEPGQDVRNAWDQNIVAEYEGCTANEAKAEYAREYGVPYTSVRVRKF